MIRLWLYAADRHTKGVLEGMNQDDLEDVAGWTGIRGVFAEYTIRTRWIDKSDDGTLSIHDWKEHQPWVFHSDKRSEAAKAAISARWERIKNQSVNSHRIRGVYGANTERNTPSPIPSPLPEDQKRTVDRAKSARFTPPTLDEVAQYCAERGNSVDPVKFHAYYTANGWRVGKNPMRKWKAAIVTWERR